VLRLKPGETIHVTDGRGLLVTAVIDALGASSTRARVSGIERNDPRPAQLVLALSLLPRAPFEAALAGCVEAGITGLVPVAAARCHARWTGWEHARRLERIAVAAMKQSGRAWLPSVAPVTDVERLADGCRDFARVVLADADAPPLAAIAAAPDTLAIVGPEAGFTEGETRRLCDAGAQRASLSEHRLRAQTAAVVVVAMLATRGGRN
jgi:16S rRNA (uracil1498-N3)-methyltransferase